MCMHLPFNAKAFASNVLSTRKEFYLLGLVTTTCIAVPWPISSSFYKLWPQLVLASDEVHLQLKSKRKRIQEASNQLSSDDSSLPSPTKKAFAPKDVGFKENLASYCRTRKTQLARLLTL